MKKEARVSARACARAEPTIRGSRVNRGKVGWVKKGRKQIAGSRNVCSTLHLVNASEAREASEGWVGGNRREKSFTGRRNYVSILDLVRRC